MEPAKVPLRDKIKKAILDNMGEPIMEEYFDDAADAVIKALHNPIIQSTPAYYKGTHQYSFRSGEDAEIIGVRIVQMQHSKRACYMLLYSDGIIDYSPIDDTHNYVIMSKP